MATEDFTKKRVLAKLRNFIKDKFNLDDDGASQNEVMENVNKGIEFKGTNLWILIFATFVASLGLNMNSTAVIIGAMLISPLMGPIMGMGLSLSINDFEMLKRSFKNFGFMVLVAILTSTVYFLISPISTAQSELLARTTPTIYDVLIAFFGGLAGIIAQSRRDRTTTVIPGVAIATALMPPLCTAGYGIATGQLSYFVGAFYLFLINTVFIAFATFFVVRFLGYHKKEFLNKEREKKVKRYITIILVATIIPSVVIGYNLIQQSLFDSNADRFVSNVVKFEKSQILNYQKNYDRKSSTIELIMVGGPVSEDAIQNITAQLPAYNLLNTKLIVRQPTVNDNYNDFNFATIGQNFEQLLNEKNRRIYELEQTVEGFVSVMVPGSEISREVGAFSGNISRIALSKDPVYSPAGVPIDTVLVCIITMEKGDLDSNEREIISRWLRTRTNTENVRLYIRQEGE